MPASSTAERPIADTREQRQLLVWWLRATVSPDDAEAMASAGYRPLPPCGGCGHCAEGYGCNREQAEQVQGGRGGKASYDARHVRAVLARLGNFPAQVVTRTTAALARLDPDERLVLVLCDGMGLDREMVGRQLKISVSTVHRTRERALGKLVRLVWEGQADA